jgi:hypothetical protein
MFSVIRRRVTYANVAVTLALVFAMSGGAYAASRYVITSTKQISPKVLKALKGAGGKSGAQGPAGAAGAQGPQGPAGAKGEAGPQGPEGKEGKQGPEGKQGAKGEPGTTGFVAALPSGKTVRGEWNVGGYAPSADSRFRTSVSYAFPLAAAPITHYIGRTEEEEEKGEFPAPPHGCTGNVESPGAENGNLCVFAASEANSLREGPQDEHFPTICAWESGVCAVGSAAAEGEGSLIGFGVQAVSSGAGLMEVSGTWAVTAE